MPGDSNVWSLITQDDSQVLVFTIPESHPHHQRAAQQIQLDLAHHLNSLAQTGQLPEGSPLQTAMLALGKEQTISITTDDRGQLIKHEPLPPSLSWLASITKQDAALHVMLDGLGKTTAEAIDCLNQILPGYWGVDPIPADLELKQLAQTLMYSFLETQQEYTINEEIIILDEKPYGRKRISIQAVANTIEKMLFTKEIISLDVLEGLRWDKSDLADSIILKTLGMSEKPAVTKPSTPTPAKYGSTAKILLSRTKPQTHRPQPTAPKTPSPLRKVVSALTPPIKAVSAKMSMQALMDEMALYIKQNLTWIFACHLIFDYQGKDFQSTDQGLLADDATLITVEHIIEVIQKNRVQNVAEEDMLGFFVKNDILRQAQLVARDANVRQASATGYGSCWHAAVIGSGSDPAAPPGLNPYEEVVYEDDDDLGLQNTK